MSNQSWQIKHWGYVVFFLASEGGNGLWTDTWSVRSDRWYLRLFLNFTILTFFVHLFFLNIFSCKTLQTCKKNSPKRVFFCQPWDMLIKAFYGNCGKAEFFHSPISVCISWKGIPFVPSDLSILYLLQMHFKVLTGYHGSITNVLYTNVFQHFLTIFLSGFFAYVSKEHIC